MVENYLHPLYIHWSLLFYALAKFLILKYHHHKTIFVKATHKSNVFDKTWSLFDESGNLRHDMLLDNKMEKSKLKKMVVFATAKLFYNFLFWNSLPREDIDRNVCPNCILSQTCRYVLFTEDTQCVWRSTMSAAFVRMGHKI